MSERIRRAGQVAWAVVGLAALLTLVGVVAWWVRVIFPPLVLAGAIVFLLNPIVTGLQRRRVPRAAGTGLSYLGFFALVTLAVILLAPLATSQAEELADDWPELRGDIEEWVNDVSARSKDDDWPVTIPNVEEIEESLESPNPDFSDQLSTVRDLGLRVFHVLLIIVLAPIVAFYLLVDLPRIRQVAESLIPEQSRAEILMVGRRLNRAIGGFFRGQLLVAFIVGAMVSIGLAVLDLPFWLIVGIVAGLFNIIPLIGPWIGAIPGVIIALTTRDFGTAVWVAVIMAGAQQIDNHFISPLVMQRVVKLHPAAVMMALLAGGTLGGFFGLLLAVPTAAVLKILLGHLWRTYVLGEPLEEAAATWAQEDDAPPEGVVRSVVGDDAPDEPPPPEPEREPVRTSGAG